MEKRRRKRSRERSPEKNKKIKGRGVRHESGLRSWGSEVKSKDVKVDIEVQKKTDTENWIKSEIKQFENKKKSKKSPVWTHDKFDKLNRSPESGSEENKVRESPTYMP